MVPAANVVTVQLGGCKRFHIRSLQSIHGKFHNHVWMFKTYKLKRLKRSLHRRLHVMLQAWTMENKLNKSITKQTSKDVAFEVSLAIA